MIAIDLNKYFDDSDIIRFGEVSEKFFGKLCPSVRRVLSEIGLPRGAAPEFQFYEEFEEYKDGFVVVGDGNDFNKIILEVTSGMVFEEVSENKLRNINSHIEKLLYTLQLYADMVESAIHVNGNKAYLLNNIPDSLIERFKKLLSEFDPEALEEGSFWLNEVNRLLSHMPDG